MKEEYSRTMMFVWVHSSIQTKIYQGELVCRFFKKDKKFINM